MQLGLVVIDENPEDALRVARAADRAGVHSLWTIDYYNRSSLTRAAAFAAATEHALIGTSITPLFARAPLAMAAAAADIQSLAHGRFILGVGSSTRRMNTDWYGTSLEHPAPQVRERVQLLRQLLAHKSGPFNFTGRFDRVSMTHLDRAHRPLATPLLAAGVGRQMVTVAGEIADGFVGHPLASAGYLRRHARSLLAAGMRKTGRDPATFRITTQVIAVAGDDPGRARRTAAAQVGFYATVKGYDPLFPGHAHAAARQAAREAFARGDVAAVADAALPMVDERAIYGRAEDLVTQLTRYHDATDWVLLYPAHYGADPEQITANEMTLIEVAASPP